jgi:hypothetical protein
MNNFVKAFTSIVTVYGAHYGSLKLYNEFCVPDGVWGFFSGIVTTGSPGCNLALKVAEYTGTTYTSIISVGITRLVLDLLV